MKSFPNLPRMAALLFLLVSIAACGGKTALPERTDIATSQIADLRFFPQDLKVYAGSAGKNRPLVDAATQAAHDARYNSIFFGPWDMIKGTTRRKDAMVIFRKARGFKRDNVLWTQQEWNAIARNARMADFPSRAQPAITVRDTDLREMPTHEPRFSEPTPDPQANPFDYFQYSLLPVGTPLFITHTSTDGRWHFVECPVAGGWVDAGDVALVDATFTSRWKTGRYAALVRDGVQLPGGKSGIGTILPISGQSGGKLSVLLPQREADGAASITVAHLGHADARPKPLPLTPGNVADIGNVMMGQRYGWGGMFGNRDCSAMVRDILTPFGVWLPRNSSRQARQGLVQPLDGLNAQDKEQVILRQGVPFLSLVALRGHVTLYVGSHKGRAALFHNVWGVRTVEDGNDNARHIIGKAVVTSVAPGLELPNLYRPVTFVDRLRTLNNPAAPLP